MDKKLVFIHSQGLDEKGYPAECPFSSKRAGMTLDILDSLGLMNRPNVSLVAPSLATDDDLLQFHTRDYIDMLRQNQNGNHTFKSLKMGLGTPDCPVFPGMFDYASLAVGGTLEGARQLLDNKADIVFNPSGGFHHAFPSAASGFCYLNDVVLAAMLFSNAGKKVVIIDVDAHHFDGVQEAFYHTDAITAISLHESGKTLFPGTGEVREIGKGKGKGHTINLPLPVGTYDEIYKDAFDQIVPAIVERERPDMIILELGMDGLAGDPLAHLNLTNNVFGDIVDDLSKRDIPMLITGGGGYNIEDTRRGWALCWGILVEGGQDDLLMNAGLSGVMLQNVAWFGGLRDRTLLSHGGFRDQVDAEITQNLKDLRQLVM